MRVVVVSGLSGSGKSVALKAMEDANFYCVDNLPAALLLEAVEYLDLLGIQDAALSIDSRSGGSLVSIKLPDGRTLTRGVYKSTLAAPGGG